MRKKLSVLLICSVALVSMIFTPTFIAADRHRYRHRHDDDDEAIFASGDWTYELGDFRYICTTDEPLGPFGSRTLIYADAVEVWSGTIEGDAYDIWFGVWDTDEPFKGDIHAQGRSYIEHACVMGKKGSLVILWVGDMEEGQEYYGEWVILSGTGGLENLHGRGTFWGPPFDIDYEGWIHFEEDDYDDDDD